MSGSVRPHWQQPTRLRHPWDSPSKTGVGCHFFLQCMKVKSESEVAQSPPTLSDPMDCSLPGSSVHGVFQARVLEWGAIAFSNILWFNYECIFKYSVKYFADGCTAILWPFVGSTSTSGVDPPASDALLWGRRHVTRGWWLEVICSLHKLSCYS